MNFQDVLNDIAKLKNHTIEGIKPGVAIDIIDVTSAGVTVRPSDGGKPKLWAAETLELLWDALNTKPAIHVDSELRGGHSSRNQPETILANLPYVDYVYVDNRKHLTRASVNHAAGVTQSATPERTAQIEREMKGN